MNLNFGTPKTTGGFTLATPTAATATPNTGLNFASGDTKGLSTTQLGAKAPSFGLSFGAAPAPSTTGFQLPPASALPYGTQLPASFGSQAMASVAPNTSLPGFSAGSILQQTLAPAQIASLLSAGLSSTPNLSLGTTASIAPNLNLGSTTTTSSASGFTLGGISSTGLTLGTPASSTTVATGFSLGKVGAAPASTATTSSGLALSASSTAPSNTLATTVTTTAATTTVPASSFTFNQLEEALNKWTLELDDQGKMFINQALQLNAWDRLVIANGEKILTLNSGIEKVKQQQQQLDRELDFVLGQQRELEECILPLEKELKDVPITDQDRNHTYQMAENMDTQLKQMSEDLKEIIEHLNESNKTEDTNDPVAQIGRILNAHMNSLQWIDRNTEQINNFLDKISKMHDMHRRDNERSFHLTYE